MKKILFFIFALSFMSYINAQTIVSTSPMNKKVILEEMTGTGCPNCPAGHTVAAAILAANPGNVFVIAYHPAGSSYTTSDPMVREFPRNFYINPFYANGGNRYMPSAMIERRIWSGQRQVLRALWTGDVDVVKVESSPLNVGVSSSYNTTSHILTVNIEVYFTSDVTSPLTLYTMITEDGIIANQSGGGASYVHNHVFREALAAGTPEQWGETIAAPTTQGTLKTFTFSFDNTTTNYVMDNCEIVVFVRDASTEDLISGNGAPVGSSSFVGIDNITSTDQNFSVFPNPLTENSVLNISLKNNSNISYKIYDVFGKVIESKNIGVLDAGNHQIDLNTGNLGKGIYFITICNENESTTIKVIK